MTPRAKIIWINVTDSHETIWHRIVVSAHSTFPVYEGTRDHILGLVTVKAIYANLAAGAAVNVRDLTTPALIVPETLSATALLERFKQSGKHVALVTDATGATAGLISLHNIMEAIVGQLPTLGDRLQPKAIRRDDGRWLVDGALDAAEFERVVTDFPLHTGADRDYSTFAGFITSATSPPKANPSDTPATSSRSSTSTARASTKSFSSPSKTSPPPQHKVRTALRGVPSRPQKNPKLASPVCTPTLWLINEYLPRHRI
jgi:Mg2+/Co2+ transporter CorC